MLSNNFKKACAQHDEERGSGRFQQPPPKQEMKVSVKVASPGRFSLQNKIDGAKDVTIWSMRSSVVAMRECLTNGRIVEEFEYRLHEEVERSD